MGRNSSGVRGGGGSLLTPSDIKAASKEVSTARANLTRAERNYNLTYASYVYSDNGGGGKKSPAIENAMQKLKQAQSAYDTAQKTYEAKVDAYKKGKKYKGK